MSKPEIIRPPAWSGLSPLAHRWHPLTGNWAQSLINTIGHSGRVLSREKNADDKPGFYRFLADDGSPPLFLKVVKQEHLAQQLAANRIADWLHTQSISVSCLLENYPKTLDKELALLASPLLDARFCQAQTDDMVSLGRLLGQAHSALAKLPWAAQLLESSNKRDQGFCELQDDYLRSHKANHPLYAMLNAGDCALPQQHQPLHGDLNQGNVLFLQHNQQPLLLDFEDSGHNCHACCVDLAMTIERFVLVPCSNDAKAEELAHQLLQGYKATHNQTIDWPMPLADILQVLARRALLLLNAESDNNQDELDKFRYLYDQTEARGALLQRIQGHD